MALMAHSTYEVAWHSHTRLVYSNKPTMRMPAGRATSYVLIIILERNLRSASRGYLLKFLFPFAILSLQTFFALAILGYIYFNGRRKFLGWCDKFAYFLTYWSGPSLRFHLYPQLLFFLLFLKLHFWQAQKNYFAY